MNRFFVVTALVALAFGACGQQGEGDRPAPLETEVVEQAPEATIDISEDAQSAQRVESLAGVLPSDVPPDLPLHRPASLVDFGSGSERYITFTSPAAPPAVRADMEQRLRAEGWAREGGGEAEVFVKEGRRITLTVEPDPVGSLWRVDY